ncbi:MAG: hypothetical protein FD136_1336 [Chitinophagaceae bacterium]|nr:MAG: hypothetical protein FD136_1336 [Chitinophagaceae bacterium]
MVQDNRLTIKIKVMKISKRVGICMDHASAQFIEFPIQTTNQKNIHSTFNFTEKNESLAKSEHLMHNKEQHEQHAFYAAIGAEILKHNKVILFGPTNAKNELLNTLKENHLFDEINISTVLTDKLTSSQQIAFVADYFREQL